MTYTIDQSKKQYALWTEEKLQQMLDLLHEGKSTRVIADIMKVTKNTIIGKLHRLGLLASEINNHKSGRPRSHRVRPRLDPLAVKLLVTMPDRLFQKKSVAAMPKSVKPPLTAQCCQILELNSHTCRWPMWGLDDTHRLYCGEETNGRTYCSRHEALGRSYPVRREPSASFTRVNRRVKFPKSMIV